VQEREKIEELFLNNCHADTASCEANIPLNNYGDPPREEIEKKVRLQVSTQFISIAEQWIS